MGQYLNPPLRVQEIGRRINGADYTWLISQLSPGEVLVGLYDRGMFMNAAHLYSLDEFEAFESQHRRGTILRLGYYAVPSKEFQRDE